MSDQGSNTLYLPKPGARPPRIHFPIDEDHFGPRAGTSTNIASSPPTARRRRHPGEDGRRRVRSVDVTNRMFNADATGEPPRPRNYSVSESRRAKAARPGWASDDQLGVVAEDFAGANAFSDEYDLSNNEPAILQDVERAMRLKARREARSKAANVYPYGTAASITSSNDGAGPSTAVPDFSPSTAANSPHVPIPLSFDNGETLEWTRLAEDEEHHHERKWSLSITKRKGKDKAPSITGAALDKLEEEHAVKIATIRANLGKRSLEIAELTRQQLGRRYGQLSPTSPPVNPLHVLRWYAQQNVRVKESIETAQPFIWLAHLKPKPGRDPSRQRSQWNLSSLIVEEFVSYTTTGRTGIRAKIESLGSAHSSPNPPSQSPRSNNRISSQFSLGPSLSRKLSTNEGHVSFEPAVESARSSLDERRKSAEIAPSTAKGWRNSLPGVHKSPQVAHKSPQTSLYGMFGGSRTVGTSPTNSRLHLKDLMRGRRAFNESDEALSSGRNSLSEGPSDDIYQDWQNVRGLSRPAQLDLSRAEDLTSDHIDIIISRPASDVGDDSNEVVLDGSGLPTGTVSDGEPAAHTRPNLRSTHASAIPEPSSRTARPFARTFLPEPVQDTARKRRKETEDQRERHSYELKAQLLDDMAAQNYRVRQLLHHVAGGIRDYDSMQAGVMKTLDVPYKQLPSELLDAIGHDPASVTGPTRRFRGWRAVEDIQSRLLRQRDTFAAYLSVQAESETPPPPVSALHEPVQAIMASLGTLETRRREFVDTAQEVADVLKRVNELHATVKSSYYQALSHVSVAYPETSHIIALEERHTDQYQQFWELGMNFVTIILDTLTPLWRSYGKTIGQDIQDFLIIPLYRNEFTGESKRYPIKKLPERSFQHWLGLLLFSATSTVIMLAQIRGAVWSTVNFRLTWLRDTPGLRWSALPFFWGCIVGQWCAVVFEIGSVVAQLGIIAWWLAWATTGAFQ